MTSLQGSAPDASPNGVNTPHLDVELDTGTTGGDEEWSPELEREQALLHAEVGAPTGWLTNYLIFDSGLSATVKVTLIAMSAFATGDRLSITPYKLAKRLGISRQALSKSMGQAESAGFLQRVDYDGAAYWRMRWLTALTRVPQRQPVVDAQRQPVVDRQPDVDVTRTRAHAELTPVLNSSSKKKTSSSGTKAAPTPLTDDERAKLHTVFDARFGSATAVDEAIEEALDHEALKKRKTEYLYLRGWLRREAWKYAETKQRFVSAKKNAEAAEARARAAKGEPTHNPLVSEKPAWLGKSIWEIEAANPSRDRTHD